MVDFWGRVLQTNTAVIEKNEHMKNSSNSKLVLPVRTDNNFGGVLAKNNELEQQSRPTKSTNIFRSVINSSNDFFSGLHTKLNAALSLDDDDDDERNGDNRSDSVYDGYMKNKQRDSGGDFGESSTTSTSWDIGSCAEGASASSISSHNQAFQKVSRYPKKWMDPTLIAKHRKNNTSNFTPTTVKHETGDKISKKSTHNNKMSRKLNKKKSSNSVLDSDPISSNDSGSESDTVTKDIESSSMGNSTSEASLLSWSSSLSHESQADESQIESMEFMKQFVDKLLNNNIGISLEEKAQFGKFCQTESGRLWFARCINAQRMNKKVGESTFYSLVQYFAIVIFECSEADDYAPAKSLMNMCFTFYHEVAVPGCEPYKEFLYLYLKDQLIWQSLRFWNAAFFDAIQCERAHRPVVTRKDIEHYSPRDISDEKEFQENITFGQLGTFTCNMHAFGLSKELCLEFLRKQSTIADLKPDQIRTIRENIELMYNATEPWRS